jgi:hypothetical protein
MHNSMNNSMNRRTNDAILNRTMRLTIIGTIAVVSLAGLILAYNAMFDLLAHQWADAAGKLVWSASAALAAWLSIHYRGELIDD